MENKELILELIEFLCLESKHSIQVRETAIENIAPLTTTDSGRQMLKKTPLVHYLFDQLKVNANVSTIIVKNALTCLINLCSISDCLLQISGQEKVISSLVENMKSSDSTIVRLSGILLNNLTHNEKGCSILLQLNEPIKRGLILSKLIEMFVFQDRMEEDPHSWIASVLMNVTQLPEGRKIILDEKKGTIALLIPFISDQNLMRRKYILGLIKNCCFEAGSIEYLISNQIDLIVHLLLPLRVGITLSEKDVEGMPVELKNPSNNWKENNAECRKLILKSLIMISSQKIGRQYLIDKRAYPIIREADKIEENEKVKEEIYTLVDLIIGEEDNPTNKNNPLVEIKTSENTKIVEESDLIQRDTQTKIPVDPPKQIEEIEEI